VLSLKELVENESHHMFEVYVVYGRKFKRMVFDRPLVYITKRPWS